MCEDLDTRHPRASPQKVPTDTRQGWDLLGQNHQNQHRKGQETSGLIISTAPTEKSPEQGLPGTLLHSGGKGAVLPKSPAERFLTKHGSAESPGCARTDLTACGGCSDRQTEHIRPAWPGGASVRYFCDLKNQLAEPDVALGVKLLGGEHVACCFLGTYAHSPQPSHHTWAYLLSSCAWQGLGAPQGADTQQCSDQQRRPRWSRPAEKTSGTVGHATWQGGVPSAG